MLKGNTVFLAAAMLAAANLAHAQMRSTTPTPNTGGSGLGSTATTPGLSSPAPLPPSAPLSTPSGIATNPSLGSPGLGLPPASALGNAPVTRPDTTLPGTLTTPGLSTLPGIAPDRSAAGGSSSPSSGPSTFCSAGSIYNPC